jgi:hypothetical protein
MSPCVVTVNTHVYALAIEAEDGITYAFPTAHLCDVVLGPNPSRSTDGPPDRALIRFTESEVEVLGTGLNRLVDYLSTNQLSRIRALSRRYNAMNLAPPVIHSLRVRKTFSA